jgi:orotate phosphoribosyltransferase
MSLFVDGKFVSHSGIALPFKIDCDALTDDDLDCLARRYAASKSMKGWIFGEVVGVPRGGLRFAEALRRYVRTDGNIVWRSNLIVDDVLTTGGSMWEFWRQRYPGTWSGIRGVVIFDRGGTLRDREWIDALFTMGPTLA